MPDPGRFDRVPPVFNAGEPAKPRLTALDAIGFPGDDAWKTQLVKTFVDNGYRMKPLVRAILVSPKYKRGNDERGVK